MTPLKEKKGSKACEDKEQCCYDDNKPSNIFKLEQIL